MSVNIRPGVSILSVLKSLNYKPWFALAEFVDNALASFLTNKARLRAAGSRKLRVEIEFDADDGGRLLVRDNAAGIGRADYARAFKPAQPPPDRRGLSEFGMGMKSAACWFARRWAVRTCALGENVERELAFDIDRIIETGRETLEPTTRDVGAGRHYTEVRLHDLHHVPQTRTLGKMKQHLASIYRIFLRDGTLELVFNGDPLEFDDPEILNAPFYKKPNSAAREWRKEIDLRLGGRRRARGFAALRATGSTAEAGFALFRRGRLIQGSADDGYRPDSVFGRSNSYTFQRLFGELHLEGFDVSHTKDGIRWDEHEDEFLGKLLEEINADPLPLIAQAEGYRSRARAGRDISRAAEAAVQRTSEVIQEHAPQVIASQLAQRANGSAPPAQLREAPQLAHRSFTVEFGGTRWEIVIELSLDQNLTDWVELSEAVTRRAGTARANADRRVGVRLALAHPFMERFCGADAASLEPLLRVAAGLVVAEVTARAGGNEQAGDVRRNLNELLRAALAEP